MKDKYVVCVACRNMHLRSQRNRECDGGGEYLLVCPKCADPGYVSPGQVAKLQPRK